MSLRKLKYLEVLDISHLDHITQDSIHDALCCEKRPSLSRLCLSSTPISPDSIILLSEMAPNLQHLDISMCVFGTNDKSVQVRKNIIIIPLTNVVLQ